MFSPFPGSYFSNNLEQSPCYCKMGQRQIADLRHFGRYKIHHQAKYQRLNAYTLYVYYRQFYGKCDSRSLLKLYISLVRPLLEYACPVWAPHAQKDIYCIERVQMLGVTQDHHW